VPGGACVRRSSMVGEPVGPEPNLTAGSSTGQHPRSRIGDEPRGLCAPQKRGAALNARRVFAQPCLISVIDASAGKQRLVSACSRPATRSAVGANPVGRGARLNEREHQIRSGPAVSQARAVSSVGQARLRRGTDARPDHVE